MMVGVIGFVGGQGDRLRPVGAPGNNTTHAAVLVGYTKDGILVAEQYVGSHGPHLTEYKFGDPRGGEKDARNYSAIDDTLGLPAGENNPYRTTVQARIAADRFAGGAMARNAHIHDMMSKSAPPGPIVVHDMTGGSVHVDVHRFHGAH